MRQPELLVTLLKNKLPVMRNLPVAINLSIEDMTLPIRAISDTDADADADFVDFAEIRQKHSRFGARLLA